MRRASEITTFLRTIIGHNRYTMRYEFKYDNQQDLAYPFMFFNYTDFIKMSTNRSLCYGNIQ